MHSLVKPWGSKLSIFLNNLAAGKNMRKHMSERSTEVVFFFHVSGLP